MLEALRSKAEAFSNESWTRYWVLQGPSILANGWTTLYPHISLETLQRVCALEGLAEAMGQLGLIKEDHVMEENDHVTSGNHMTDHVTEESSITVNIGTNESAPVSNVELASAHDSVVGTESDMDTPLSHDIVVGTGNDMERDEILASPSDEDILVLWSEHYNAYYWYCYQLFCKNTGKEVEEGEGDGERDGAGECGTQNGHAVVLGEDGEVEWEEPVLKEGGISEGGEDVILSAISDNGNGDGGGARDVLDNDDGEMMDGVDAEGEGMVSAPAGTSEEKEDAMVEEAMENR